jgi:hypothetical protein
MTGVTPSSDALFDGVPLEQPPSNRQGFGRLQLSNSLPLTGSARSLQVVPRRRHSGPLLYNSILDLESLLMKADPDPYPSYEWAI